MFNQCKLMLLRTILVLLKVFLQFISFLVLEILKILNLKPMLHNLVVCILQLVLILLIQYNIQILIKPYYPTQNFNNKPHSSEPVQPYPPQLGSQYKGTCQIYKKLGHSAKHCRFRYATQSSLYNNEPFPHFPPSQVTNLSITTISKSLSKTNDTK